MIYRSATPLDIDQQVRPGDILAFSGHGIVSETIKIATGSHVSHIGIVLDAGPCAMLIESTSIGGFRGVTEGPLVERGGQYDGSAWWLPLRDRFIGLQKKQHLRAWLDSQAHKRYDTWGAVGAGLRLHLGAAQEWFCSELAAAALQHIGVLPVELDASLVRPCDIVRMPIFTAEYYQIKGPPEAL